MKRFFSFLFAFVFVALSAGCATKVVDRVVTKTEYVIVAPEAQYLLATAVPAPPKRVVFGPGEIPDFESLYRDQALSAVELYKSLHSCNKDKTGAQADITQKRKLYE